MHLLEGVLAETPRASGLLILQLQRSSYWPAGHFPRTSACTVPISGEELARQVLCPFVNPLVVRMSPFPIRRPAVRAVP